MKHVFAIALFTIFFSLSINHVYAATEPDPPIELEADDVAPKQIVLSWEPPEDDGDSEITGYKIEYKIIPNDYQILVADTGNNSTTYTHSNLQTGKTYIYRIFAINSVGTSEESGEAAATPTASSAPPEDITPNPPTNVSANDVSPTQIDISWSKPAANNGPKVTGYTVEKKTAAGQYSVLINNTSTTSYSDTGLETGETFIYRVFALNSVGFSDASEEANATTSEVSAPPVEQIVPSEPRGVSASAVSPSEIILDWFEPRPNEGPAVTGYKIEFATKNDYTTLVENTGTTTTYKHSGLEVGKTYSYKIYAINTVGLSEASSEISAKPEHTLVPTAVTANAVSPTQVDLSWNPPSQTYGQEITGYQIQQLITTDYYETIHTTGKGITNYSVTNLETGKEYIFVIIAKFTLGSSDISKQVVVTPTEDSVPPPTETVPNAPTNLVAVPSSPTKIDLSWSAPTGDGGSLITGYKIEMKVSSGSFITISRDTENTLTTYTHSDREENTNYTYRIYAINSVGTSESSNEASADTSKSAVPVESGTTSSPPSGLEVDLTETNKVTVYWEKPFITGGSEISAYVVEAKKDSESFKILTDDLTSTSFVHEVEFDSTYTYRISAINAIGTSTPSNIVSITIEPEVIDPTKRIPGFPDPDVPAQDYIDRYNTESAYKEWFDRNFPDFTIYEVLGIQEPIETPEETSDESAQEITDEPEIGVCGEGTVLIDGICTKAPQTSLGGGCLIATAAFGSELAPQVQFLREVRDNTILSTGSGVAFMSTFNQLYYSFSPTIADLQRESPVFKEVVKLFITPMILTLSIMTLAENGSESNILTTGISVIALNLAMYIAVPAAIVFKLKKLVF